MRLTRRLLGALLPAAALTAVVPAVLLASSTTAAATTTSADEDRRSGPVEIVAHRGASDDAPENTLAAVDEAVAQRADTVEVDVQRTADGELVLLHDATLARTTDVEQVFPDRALAPVGAFTLAELRRLDAGSWFGPRFAGEQIPTLAELLDRTGDRAALLLELKDPALYDGIEGEVAAAVAGAPRVAVQSFDHDAMRRFAGIAPDVEAGWLFSARPTDAQLDAAATVADQVNPSSKVVDAALVTAVAQRGLTTGVYTVNEEADMRALIDAGVDRVITDRPAVLREVSQG